MHLSLKFLGGLTSFCLLVQPLAAEETAHVPQLMTEAELLKTLDAKDQATYLELSQDGKTLVIKMASLANDPVMQKCKQVMGVIQNMRDMLKQFESQLQQQHKEPKDTSN